MRCRGAHRLALPPFLSGFLCSGLLRVAPYCVPGIGESTRLAPRLALPRRGDVVGDTVLRSGTGGTPRGRIARRSLLHLRSPTRRLWVNRTAARVAEELGTGNASLYWHFANQDELLGWDFGRGRSSCQHRIRPGGKSRSVTVTEFNPDPGEEDGSITACSRS